MNQTITLTRPSLERKRASAPSSPVLSLRSCSVEEFLFRPLAKESIQNNVLPPPPSSKDEQEPPLPSAQTTTKAGRTRILFRSDLIARGETSASIRRKVHSGELVHISRGWYATEPITDKDFLRELQQILPKDVVFAAETAAVFYGVDTRSQDRPNEPFRLCLLRPRGQRSLRRPGERCRSMMVDEEDVVEVEGIRITSPLRTLCDIVMSERIDRATALVEEFLRKQLVTIKELWSAIAVRRGRRGVKTLRRAVREADPQSESVQETAVRLRLKEAGLPAPDTQIEVRRQCGRKYRMDLGWACGEGGVAVEYYGQEFHPESGAKAQADEERLSELADAGWQAIVVRARDMAGIEPVFERRVAEALQARMGRRFRVGLREKW